MATYRIVCTEQEPVTQPTSHAHIVAVGTGIDPDQATKRWTLNEVLAAMEGGDTFYTKGKSSGQLALVRRVACDTCGRYIIRSAPDAVWDNNLDSLRRCNF
jgi:hypothetical protein